MTNVHTKLLKIQLKKNLNKKTNKSFNILINNSIILFCKRKSYRFGMTLGWTVPINRLNFPPVWAHTHVSLYLASSLPASCCSHSPLSHPFLSFCLFPSLSCAAAVSVHTYSNSALVTTTLLLPHPLLACSIWFACKLVSGCVKCDITLITLITNYVNITHLN